MSTSRELVKRSTSLEKSGHISYGILIRHKTIEKMRYPIKVLQYLGYGE